METRNKVALLVFISVLLIVSISLASWLLLRDDGTAGLPAAGVSSLEFISSLYQFQDMHMPKADLSAVNACADGNAVVECVDDECSNCVCPYECEQRGMAYMMMDMQGERSYRCSCANSLDDLVDTGPWQEYAILPDIKEAGAVWEIINKWENRLLPADPEKDTDRFRLGVGGLYPYGHVAWGKDALNKVYIGSSSMGNLAAVYKRGKPSEPRELDNNEVSEDLETFVPVTESAAPE